MSGIPHIYDSPNIFDAYEIDDYDESDYSEEYEDYEYSELCEKIREHIIEEKRILEWIKKMEGL